MLTTPMIWHDNTEVQQLLESIRSDPPATETYEAPSNSSRGNKSYTRYVGERVDRLTAIRKSLLDSALILCDAIDDHTLFNDLSGQDDVDELIRSVLTPTPAP